MASETEAIRATARAEIDQAVADLQAIKQAWVATSIAERLALIDRMLVAVAEVAPRWAADGQRAKGVDPHTAVAGEEWLSGPYVTARNLRLLRLSLVDIDRHGSPRVPGQPRMHAGRVVAPVVPVDTYDRLMFSGYTAEVWMRPSVPLEGLTETMAVAYRAADPQGGVCLVLGAGNVASIGPTDAFYKLFVESQVVLLKMHPVNEYLTPHFNQLLQPLIERGVVRIVCGGAEEGNYLCHHPEIDAIHLTGSDRTHDAIVFGSPEPAGDTPRQPTLHKPVSSELGNVTGVIVVPGQWRPADIARQAENLAAMLTNNAGFNCNALRVIVTQAGWPQQEALLDGVRQALAAVPHRRAYYPGAADRFERFRTAHPEAEPLGDMSGEGTLPWLLIPGVDPERKEDICFTTEAFCSVACQTSLAADSVASFLNEAVRFVNETLWGTLAVSLIVDPHTERDPTAGAAVERAVADLRFGTVAVNHWAGVGYGMCAPTWGAFPGHDIHDIQSGIGVVHNTLMFSQAEKSVIRGPFRPWPKPAWFPSHRQTGRLAPKLVDFEAHPSLWKLPGISWRSFG